MNLGFNVDIVSVLVHVQDNPDQLSETISSIFHSVDQPDIEVEIIVIAALLASLVLMFVRCYFKSSHLVIRFSIK